MIHRLSADQFRTLRLRSQRLIPDESQAGSSVAQLLKELCGVQAQEAPSAALALRARGRDLGIADVERARVQERSIVRAWCMRGTLHLLAKEDLGWLTPLLGPLFIRKSHRRYAQLGLDEAKSARAIRAIRELLDSQGSMTRRELAGDLAERGIQVEGQAIYHLLRRASLEGVLCYGPDRDGEPTYMLLEEEPGPGAQSGDEAQSAALAALARRYLAAYAPAGPRDLANWSGLPLGQARSAFEMIRGELLEIESGEQPAWMLKNRAEWLGKPFDKRPAARLLPAFDTLLLGYHRRDLFVPERHARRVHPGGGLIRPVLLLNGQAAATWRLGRKKGHVVVTIDPFEPLPADAAAPLQDEVENIGRFLGTKSVLND